MLGEELKKAREQAGKTQEKLALDAGLSRPYISQLERDKKSPTLDTLFLLCDALGISAQELVGRVEQARRPKRRR
jgi:transcriptional regulator with XRE-family HTH domain